jgi:hypothetical protein
MSINISEEVVSNRDWKIQFQFTDDDPDSPTYGDLIDFTGAVIAFAIEDGSGCQVITAGTADGKVAIISSGLLASNFVTLVRNGGTYTLGADYTVLPGGPISDPTTAMFAVYDATSGLYREVSLSSLLASSLLVVQHITAPGPAAINAATGIVRVNQTVGATITLTLPLASAKTCPVLVSDWKGDAGTNNITINTTAPDTFPGGLTSWKIAADTGSITFRPIAGTGYAL